MYAKEQNGVKKSKKSKHRNRKKHEVDLEVWTVTQTHV